MQLLNATNVLHTIYIMQQDAKIRNYERGSSFTASESEKLVSNISFDVSSPEDVYPLG
jgi:hypothetical protein